MPNIFVAATQQHAGKTCMCLGLYAAARDRGYKACFIKPVGQRYVTADDEDVDEDAVLFKHALGSDGYIKDLSPVTIPRGFTTDYVFHRNPDRIRCQIMAAFRRIEEGHDVVIVEGTGHAGVGSVIDVSNADVAHMLDACCLIVSGGGVGRCIDEIALNRALFERVGVPLAGAIVNKVFEEKYDHVSRAVRQGLANLGVDCLGVVPYHRELTYPTMQQLKDEFGFEVLCGAEHLGNRVKSIIVAAMAPQHAVGYLEDGCLVVVPGDRIDNIIASVNAHLMTARGAGPEIAGLLLTGDFVPHLSIVNILWRVDVPVLLTAGDTASSAFKVRGLVAKILETDYDKIALSQELVMRWVDVDKVFDAAGLG